MSDLKVKVEIIHEIKEHPNADRMELAVIGGAGGWQCCVQKDKHKAGGKVIYFPVDSVLTDKLVDTIFGPDSRVKLSKNRVRTIKLRGAISQGLAVPCELIYPIDFHNESLKLGEDLTKALGVTKYEPPTKGSPTSGAGRATKKNENKHFTKYTNINHLRNYPSILDGMEVAAFEKIHGTNFRAGWVPFVPATWWERFKKKHFGFGPSWQFVYGSHNVQLQGKYKGSDFYSRKTSMDVYSKMVKQYDLMNALKHGEVIYAEIYGHGIQKNFTYGCKQGEHDMVVVDMKFKGNYVDAKTLATWCFLRGFNLPPLLYTGPWDQLKMDKLVQGTSELDRNQKVREGMVVRPAEEQIFHGGRMIFKYLNPDYLLLKGNSEHH